MKNNLLIVSLATIVGIELIGVAVVGFWALGSLLDVSETLTLILSAAGGLIALWMSVRFTQRAYSIEKRFF